jgi:predicted transcriptional regulator
MNTFNRIHVLYRKSIGAEVNWGVRFGSWDRAEVFVRDLCAEIEARLRTAGMLGKTVTFKMLKKRCVCMKKKYYIYNYSFLIF